ncbi:DoxX family membrane protein [Paenibacillus apiarius]|uniref:DoxX family membrane protein n=1 Tax=Paenibacillus apiarius TaxID=46240 RepID=A0ABT4DW32_9BACL|nr:DoxX family membrane protein [Paenibacillus apiarius]MBN3526665.1 DoxX family membrane protein [Paenibacillus apiarius]MCY9513082.1 DoxX family membrane protein [Paenibacillus apiarius]MCY9521560.1 DoxX family membrane protein [Paenibacillus apiarius]MCY9551714.1 DoxX family membrane protein [Paenibacillus apiarius]MCY9560498.1 DoxX family membrane protein [Paenibacillus apiarius]
MFVHWLRSHVSAAVLLCILRLYVGYKWVTAGWGKLTNGFDASGFLESAISKSVGDRPIVPGWWAWFLKHVALPTSGFFSYLVAIGELLVGLGLILGLMTWLAAVMGMVMNFSYLFSGSISWNPLFILICSFIAVAGWNAGKIGLDGYFFLGRTRRIPTQSQSQTQAQQAQA